MKRKEFKAESKRLMDLMINSIYTNKDIFLREIISNASDALDKLHYNSLTDKSIKIDKKKLEIDISFDKNARTITISDNGIGMNKEELENNLGTIAKSGSFDFKHNNEHKKDIDIIGQFGVGFYSAFMVAKKVEVISKAYQSNEAYSWVSEGIDGYVISPSKRDTYGTDVILTLKDDNDEENYSKYLDEYTIKELIKKYSNYITYPIKMEVVHRHLKDKKNKDDKDEYEEHKEVEVLNDLIPLWKRNKKDITDSDYETFYNDKFFDYEKPISKIHYKAEGAVDYNALLYIPSHASFDYYTKEYEKGLQLYSNGVLIMEKCKDILPDYFSFVKGVVDSSDLPLNISRETIQQNRILKTIEKSVEGKIKNELLDMIKNRREDYEKFYKDFGMQLKYGIYADYGMNKEKLQDLIMFISSKELKYTTLDEYVERKRDDQKYIYYACGESTDNINLLPQVDAIKEQGYEVLYCSDYVDEFVLKTINKYKDLEFKNVADNKDEEDSDEITKENKDNKDMFDLMLKELDGIKEIKFTNKLKNHPICLSTTGDISIEMEKAMSQIPNSGNIKANKVLEININHDIAKKLKDLYKTDKETLKKYAKILYAEARLIEGLQLDNPTEISNLIAEIMAK